MQLERPVEEQKCEFVNEFGRLYLVAGEEMVWQTWVFMIFISTPISLIMAERSEAKKYINLIFDAKLRFAQPF